MASVIESVMTTKTNNVRATEKHRPERVQAASGTDHWLMYSQTLSFVTRNGNHMGSTDVLRAQPFPG